MSLGGGYGVGSALSREWTEGEDGQDGTVEWTSDEIADDPETGEQVPVLDPAEPDGIVDFDAPEIDEVLDAGGWNHVENSSFEDPSGADWSWGSGWSLHEAGASAVHGTRVARLVATGASGALESAAWQVDSARPGSWWVTWHWWLQSWTAGTLRVVLREYDANGVIVVETTVGEHSLADVTWDRSAWQVKQRSSAEGDHLWHIDTAMARIAFMSAGGAGEAWIDGVQAEIGTVRTAYAPRPNEVIPGGAIVDGSLPGSAFDTTPPAVPVIAAVSSATTQAQDGSLIVELIGTLTAHPADADYIGCEWQATAAYTLSDPADPQSSRIPDWTRPVSAFQNPDDPQVAILGVPAVTEHAVRARSRDTQGNRSAWSSTVVITTVGDGAAPPVPDVPTIQPIMRGLLVLWNRSLVPDIAIYEVRYRITGSTDDWNVVRTRGTLISLQPLTATEDQDGNPSTGYDVQVRAIDTSNQVATSAGDPTVVLAHLYPDAGWSATATGYPALTKGVDLAAGSVTTEHLRTGSVTADKVGAGTIIVNTTTDPDHPDGISVQLAGAEVARLDEDGLTVWETDSEAPDFIQLTAGRLRMVRGGLEVGSFGPDGIDAAAIRLGIAQGGHNLIRNSSFELQQVGIVQTTLTDTVAADWSGNRVGSLDNLNEATNDLRMTAAAF